MKTKTFDCVKMKEELQKKMLLSAKGLSDKQAHAVWITQANEKLFSLFT